MKTLKQEEIDGRAYRHADEARGSIGSFIDQVYNRMAQGRQRHCVPRGRDQSSTLGR